MIMRMYDQKIIRRGVAKIARFKYDLI
jgi:hypothetical protein